MYYFHHGKPRLWIDGHGKPGPFSIPGYLLDVTDSGFVKSFNRRFKAQAVIGGAAGTPHRP